MLLHWLTHKKFLLKTTFIFWLIAKIMSYKLWLATRFFPIVPAFDVLNFVPSFAHTILFSTSLLLLFYSIFYSNKNVLSILLLVEILSCLLDQNRWQPWQYQYMITLLIFIIHFNNAQKIVAWAMLICATTYFYSGLQKFNLGFLTIVWQDAFLHKFFKLPMHIVNNKYLANIGYAIPILEVYFGLSFFFAATKKIALYLLVAMHLVILTLIGPLGLIFNLIVWPWNALMLYYLLHFIATRQFDALNIRDLLNSSTLTIAIVWCIFPMLNFLGYWDYFMSFSLYSGRIPNMEICVQNQVPKELDKYFHLTPSPKICNGQQGVNIQVWGMEEILVPPLPQVRVYKKVKEVLQKKYPTMQANYYVYWLPKCAANYIELK